MIKETNSIHKQRGISLFDPSLFDPSLFDPSLFDPIPLYTISLSL
jgi:hypothetical protein